MNMKKMYVSILTLLLVVTLAGMAQAAPCQDGQGSVAVSISVTPDIVCTLDNIWVTAVITNNGNCSDIFDVSLGLSWEPIPNTDVFEDNFAGKDYCRPLLPRLLVPLLPDGTFSFTYSGQLPPMVPPGKYRLTIRARGQFGGSSDVYSTHFTVLPCSTPGN
jgi:hypothetical protein